MAPEMQRKTPSTLLKPGHDIDSVEGQSFSKEERATEQLATVATGFIDGPGDSAVPDPIRVEQARDDRCTPVAGFHAE